MEEKQNEVLARLTAAARYADHATTGRCTAEVAAAQMRALLDAADEFLKEDV